MSLLTTGVSALITSQSQLATTGHNISNVNTEGYSRQRVGQVVLAPNIEGQYYIGSGVTVGGVERLYDDFLASQVRTLTSQQSQNDAFGIVADQIDNILGSSALSLAGGLEAFFNAANAVANDPTSIAARQVLLSQGQSLANRFTTLDSQLGQIDNQLNGGIGATLDEINMLSKGIAELNLSITELSSSPGGEPNDLLDQRDQLINRLSAFVSVSTVEEYSGAVSVFVGNGQGLVVGFTQIDLTTLQDNSTNPPRVTIGYGPSSIDITTQITGGSLGGALRVRGDVIDSARAELDNLAQALIDNANVIQQQGITLNGNLGTNFFGPTPPSTTIAGAGSIFVALTDPLDIAAAYPASVTSSPSSIGTGKLDIESIDALPPLTLPLFNAGANIEFIFNATTNQYAVTDGTNISTISYDPAVDSGKTVTLTAPFFDLTLKFSGVPADADQFTIGNNTAVGDNRNALALANLQTDKILASDTQSLLAAYQNLIGDVATRASRANINRETQQGLLDQVKDRFASVSGVNLDEEAANLLRYQQAYQAASQIITVSNTVFNSLLSAL